MRRLGFLDNDSVFGRLCTLIGTIIAANLLFAVTLIPVVTAGAGLCALYYTMLKLLREKEINPFSEFFAGFKDNVKSATLAWIGILALGAFLAFDLRICSFMTGFLHNCVFVIAIAVIALAIIAMYLFPVMASFHGRLRDHIRYSVFFAGSNPLYLLIIAAVNVVPMTLTYMNAAILPLTAFLWCMFGFALTSLVCSFFFLRMFRHYLDKRDDDSEEDWSDKKLLEEMKKLEG